MKLNTIQMPANSPSLGMPTCGHAFPTSTAGFGTTFVVRDRQAAKGDMGLAAYVPGTSAWRPPSS